VLHSGTALVNGAVVCAGGRVVGCTATGVDLEHARRAAYELVDRVRFAGAHHRTDIARAAVAGEVAIPG
jgi:phosphoribosylamine--glycine ligase